MENLNFKETVEKDVYDLIVIGGGSGGLACSKEAAELGKKVVVLDYVRPTPLGTSWGLGGTCVNVGCIPKKLMHLISQLSDSFSAAEGVGWSHRLVKESLHTTIDWDVMSSVVQNYVKSLNWGHRVQLRQKSVEYLNAEGSFIDHETILARLPNGDEKVLRGRNIIVAVGGRPNYPEIPGSEKHGITSDDLFWLKKPPGKTLIIGGSYVALECAGFLHGMGFPVSVMVRSICLRSFDQQMARLVTEDMESHRGVPFLWKCVPLQVKENPKQQEPPLVVSWKNTETGEVMEDCFDTVIFATGRTPVTESLQLNNAKIQWNQETKKIVGGFNNEWERTSQPNVFAIGDVLQNGVELTPVAIKAGKLLARRLFAGESEQMNYDNIATTVFTPLEYGCVGLSEELAKQRLGENNIEVYHAFYKPLEYVIARKEAHGCYIKVICDKQQKMKIIGFHITGLNAGEITQGFAAVLTLGANWQQLSQVVGIHPTSAEEVVKMHITKQSGGDATVTGC